MAEGIRAVIFDLDGGIADTAGYHFRAWKRLADEEGLSFTPEDNEELRGVPDRELLLRALKGRPVSESDMLAMIGRKDAYYQELLAQITPDDLLPGVPVYTQVDYGPVRGEVVTWLHPTQSLLVERYTFSQEVEFRAWMGPGVWVEEGWDSDPFYAVEADEQAAHIRYDLGETRGLMLLRVANGDAVLGKDGLNRSLTVRSRQVTKYFAIIDNRQGALDPAAIDRQIARGYDVLRQEHLDFWREYSSASSIEIPDPQFQYFYDASMYHFKAMQNRASGGLPVNNLRRTWSSHVFWDSYFLQRALLEANHRREALEGCRFFQRTLDHARRHASEEFGCDGLKWDWEITHDGRKAYGALLHMKYQIHNNGSYANEIWGYYEYTRDLDMLREFFPILEGLARFYLNCIVAETDQGYEVGYQVGVHESPDKVRNDGMNLSATIAILRHCAEAARLLGLESDFTRRCAAVADGMIGTMGHLYNGRYFRASEDRDILNMSSLGPIYPMGVIQPADPRAIQTALAFVEKYRGGVIGDGTSENGFPWLAGVLATVLARQNTGDLAWTIIETTRPTICNFGGMTEVLEAGQWNMQYFGTAQAAVCTALHQLLLQPAPDGTVRLFPALPSCWNTAAFENLLASGLAVSARYSDSEITCTVRNESPTTLTRRIQYRDQATEVTLDPGELADLRWTA